MMSSIDEITLSVLENAPAPDEASGSALRERAANVPRPAGALARLDDIAVWLASWQRTTTPAVSEPAVVVFVADHGVTTEGVSAYPAEVTVAMLRALNEGVATAAAMSRSVGASLHVVDVGVGDPPGNIAVEPAMSDARFRACFDAGREAVSALNCDLVIFGEMGI